MTNRLNRVLRIPLAGLEALLGGGQAWGYLRLGLMLILVYLWAAWNRRMWVEPGAEPYPLWWPIGWRYFIPAVFALLGGLLAAGNYAARLYQLNNWRAGLRYVWANAASLGLPRLQVQDGKPEIEVGQSNLIQQVGGPGYLYVRPGTAVALESLTQPTRVLGAGRHFITRTERIRDLISLADQHASTERLSNMSKDGIEVAVQKIKFRYRLLADPHAPPARRTAQDPYPFLAEAARNLVYQRSVNAAGLLAWDQAVRNAVEGVLTNYITVNWFDKVMAPLPSQADPRAAMDEQMRGIQGNLQGFGTELLWADIGHFTPASSTVDDQRVETWGVKWVGEADMETARSDADRQAAQELGRAEAQAEMLNNLLGVIMSASRGRSPQQNLSTIILLRTAQLLDTMVEAGRSAASRTPPEQPDSLAVRRMLLPY